MCSESSLYWGEPEHGGAFVGIYSLEVVRSIMQGFGWLPTPHSPEGCLSMYDTPPLFPPFPLLAWCNSPLNLENTYREHFRPRPVWIILALPAPEAATWVFISEVLNSGRTCKIILKTNGAWLWEDETQQNETPPLQGVAALSCFALFPRLLWVVGIVTPFPGLNTYSVWESVHLPQSTIIIQWNVVLKIIEQGKFLLF